MRVAVSGTQCIGKSTFIEDFKQRWAMYRSPKRSYRDLINEKGLVLNQDSTEDSQRIIMNAMIDIQQEAKGNFLIFDRCPWDNIAYNMWLNAKGKVTDAFMKEMITLSREAMVFYDIVFFFPICKQSPVRLEAREHRDIDPIYRQEIDILFKSLMNAYQANSKVFYPFDTDKGSPAFIEMFGTREERLQLASFYINEDGTKYGDGESLLDEEMTPEKIALAREAFGLS